MSFENLDQNFEDIAQKKAQHKGAREDDAMKHFEKNHEQNKAKYEQSVNDVSGLLSMFQKKLAQSTPERIRGGEEFDTISVTPDNITKPNSNTSAEEVSEENIEKLLGKTKEEPQPSENKPTEANPISNLVVEQTNVQIVNSEEVTKDLKPKQKAEETLVVDRTRYGDNYPEMNKRAQTSDGLSQQAILRAANGESVNGMPGGTNDEVDDYIGEQLKIHNENKLKIAQQNVDKNSSGSFGETVISQSNNEPDELTETELTETDITPTSDQ
jgi:hypothetical protein